MSGSRDDAVVLAGEYVLGLLDAPERLRVEAQALDDQMLADEIMAWEDNLTPLLAMIAPVQPPQALWARLALASGVGSSPGAAVEPGVGTVSNISAAPAAARRTGSARPWQFATAASMAVAACLAVILLVPQPPATGPAQAQFVAALGPLNAAASFVALTRPDGSIALTRVAGAPAPAGRDFELWSLPQGATRPEALGVLPAGGTVVRPANRPLADEQLLISDEPTGGSPTGQPTGTVLAGGTLKPVNPAPAPGR